MKKRSKKDNKEYFKYIDLIRLISCIAVLLYHFNILKGGYLAVCTFFVLTGYLSCVSNFKKEKFSIWSYYYNRLKKIYLPLVIVVFVTVTITSFIPNILWLNLKQEVTSIILGYNNFWQLSANLDYFARHVNSPFMHFWYIGILLQFELLFPFVFLLFKKIGDKVHKSIPGITFSILSILGVIYFYKIGISKNIMITYYHTLTRIFSILFGLSLGFILSYYKDKIFTKIKKPYNKILFYLLSVVLVLLFIFVSADSKYFQIAMIITSLISCALIILAINMNSNKMNFFDKTIKSLSKVSYEIYLVQYPVIFFFQLFELNKYLELLLMIIIILLISYFIHYVIDFKNKKLFIVKIIGCVSLGIFSLYGIYHYIIAKDHTDEMKLLETQLAENEKLFQEKMKEYEALYQKNEEEWLKTLENLENDEEKLKDVVRNIQIIGVGDSVMLGALTNLYKSFPNGYFDAQKSRTCWVVEGILKDLKNKNVLGDTILINMGANGDCPEHVKDRFMKTLSDKKVFWVNVANDQNKNANKNLKAFKEKYDNLYIIDWNKLSKGHSEYFIADKIHLTEKGRIAYSKIVYDSIYEVYLQEYLNKKEEIIKDHEEPEKTKISFFGNGILLNAYNYLQEDFNNHQFNIDSNFDFNSLRNNIETLKNDNNLNYKVAFILDGSMNLTKKEYEELINLCDGHQIYFVSLTEYMNSTLNNLININIINYYNELLNHKEYLMKDNIHLTESGNIKLNELLKDSLINLKK